MQQPWKGLLSRQSVTRGSAASLLSEDRDRELTSQMGVAAASVLMSHQALQRDHGIVTQLLAVINSICHTVHAAIWALLIAGSVVLLLHIPEMRKGRAIAEARRLQEISEQNRFYCEKWGMTARSHEHVICMMDLDHIRKDVEQRIADGTEEARQWDTQTPT